MPSPEHRRSRALPDWAQKERVGDLAWIGENLHILWPAAQHSYAEQGRGAIIIDTTTRVSHQEGAGNPVSHPPEARATQGNPIFYMTEAGIEEMNDADALRMVRGYEPSWEMVTMLFKIEGRVSTYRVGVPHAKQSAATS